MGIPVGEMCSRMSNYELCVLYPAYFRQLNIHEEAEARKREGR